ncbi:hypothetical protein [Clostridium chromiireducens]|nr:hypothetical protein [Clostridium chromiireducens]
MKIRKLLSMGALSLVVACSTSIGALAAETQTISKSDLLISMVVNQYINGTNQTGLFAGINKDTKIGTVVTADFLGDVKDEFGNYNVVDKALTKFDKDKEFTIAQILQKATKDEVTFNKYKKDFIEIATKVQAMDALTGEARKTSEMKVINTVKAYDSNLSVTFGKDAEGRTTATIKRFTKTIIQLNYEDVQKVIDKVNSITWKQIEAYKNLY